MNKFVADAANAATWALIAIPLIAAASAAHAQALMPSPAPAAAYAQAGAATSAHSPVVNAR